MKPSPIQQDVIAFISKHGGEVAFSEISAEFGVRYYTSSEYHVGQLLSRMVKSGFVKRVRKGVYVLGDGKKPPKAEESANHPTLF